jgi:hypothetical protein
MWLNELWRRWLGTPRARRLPIRRPRPRKRDWRPLLEVLEDRSLPSSYTAATVSDLVADINASNTSGGSNTITLTAPTTSPYVLTAVDNTTDGATGLPVIASGDTLTSSATATPSSATRPRRTSACWPWPAGGR